MKKFLILTVNTIWIRILLLNDVSILKIAHLRHERGVNLLNNLKNQIKVFLKDNQIEFHEKIDENAVIIGVIFEEKIPFEWTLIASEILHQFRSSLDNAIFAIIRKHYGIGEDEIADHQIAFHLPDEIDATMKDIFNKISKFPPELVELIESCLPITIHKNILESLSDDETKNEYLKFLDCLPIRHLRRFSNIDKHRYLHILGGRVSKIGLVNSSIDNFEFLSFATNPLNSGEVHSKYNLQMNGKVAPFGELEVRIFVDGCFGSGHELTQVLEEVSFLVQSILAKMSDLITAQ